MTNRQIAPYRPRTYGDYVKHGLAFSPGKAKADDLDDLLDGLVNVVIQIDRFNDLIYVNDVNILDYNYVNVSDLLDDDEINVLSELISLDDVASFNQLILDDILQNFGILDGSQVVVGVLSDQGIIYYLDGGGDDGGDDGGGS